MGRPSIPESNMWIASSCVLSPSDYRAEGGSLGHAGQKVEKNVVNWLRDWITMKLWYAI